MDENYRKSLYNRLVFLEKQVGKLLDKLDKDESNLQLNEVYSKAKNMEYKVREITDLTLLELYDKDKK